MNSPLDAIVVTLALAFLITQCSPLPHGPRKFVTSGDSATQLSYYERLAARPSPKHQYLGGLGMLGWSDQCARSSPTESAAYRERALKAISSAAAGGWPAARRTLEFRQR